MSNQASSLLRDKWLVLAALSSLALVILSALTERFALEFAPLGWLRVVLGVIVVLLCPGYALQVTLLPHANGVSAPERLAVAFGLSVAILPPVALVLSYTPWGVRAWPLLLSLTGVTCGMAIITLISHWRVSRPAEGPAEPEIRQSLGAWWREQDWLNRSLLGVVIGALALAGVAIMVLMIMPRPGDRFTEFYVLGPDGLGQDYPHVVTAGEPFTLTAAVRNQEGTTAHYTIFAQIDKQIIGASQGFTIADGTTQTQTLELILPLASADQTLELVLDRRGYPFPYRTLQLWLKARPSGVP